MRHIRAWLRRMHPLPTKAEGNMLIISVALSAMVVTLGLGLQKVLLTDLRFSAHLLQSEQAHFAAETGVEQALLWLQDEEIEHLQDFQPEDAVLVEGVSHVITIENELEEFQFVLGPEEAKQITLRVDPDPDHRIRVASETLAVDLFGLTVEPMGPTLPFSGVPNTYELNKCLGSPNNTIESVAATGQRQSIANNEDVCIVQFVNQNVATQTDEDPERAMTFRFDHPTGMSPHRAQITSKGRAGTREKHLSFGLERNRSLLNRNLFVQ